MASESAPKEAIYHLTHWKAGSQWVQGLLRELAPRRYLNVPEAVADGIELCPVQAGRIYSPLYLNKIRFDESPWAAAPHRKFLVIRDLRDALVSWYFSLLKTHGENPSVVRHRARLKELELEAGLLYLLDHEDFFGLAMICSTWLGAADILTIQFEEMIERPLEVFGRICSYCGIEVDAGHLERAVARRNFAALSGRPRGADGPPSHYRRGVAGDWKNHFTEKVSMEFSRRYDDLIWRCGYEPILPPGHWKRLREAGAAV